MVCSEGLSLPSSNVAWHALTSLSPPLTGARHVRYSVYIPPKDTRRTDMLSHISAMLTAQANRRRIKRVLAEIDEAKAAYAAEARIPFYFTTGRIGQGEYNG